MKILIPQVITNLNECSNLVCEILYLPTTDEQLFLIESGLFLEVIKPHLQGFVVKVVHSPDIVHWAVFFYQSLENIHKL